MTKYILYVSTALIWLSALASAEPRRIPDEYESTGGVGSAYGNSGVAVVDGLAAVRTNPAQMVGQRLYRVGGGYTWPTEGREFFQAGIVDSKTAKVAAGMLYTGFSDDYRNQLASGHGTQVDSPVIRRGQIAVGQNMGNLSLGIGGHYVEAHKLSEYGGFGDESERVKGTGLMLGGSVVVGGGLRLAASGDNISNKKIRDYAPRTLRAGAAYPFQRGGLLASLDYRQRDRVGSFEGQTLKLVGEDPSDDPSLQGPERMVFGSFTAFFREFFRLVATYGHGVGYQRRSLAGGIAVVNKQMTLSYNLNRPYMHRSATQQTVHLGVNVSM